MTKMDALGITTVLTANTDFQVFSYRPTLLCCNAHQTADTFGVDTGEGIVLEQTALQILNQEARLSIIP